LHIKGFVSASRERAPSHYTPTRQSARGRINLLPKPPHRKRPSYVAVKTCFAFFLRQYGVPPSRFFVRHHKRQWETCLALRSQRGLLVFFFLRRGWRQSGFCADGRHDQFFRGFFLFFSLSQQPLCQFFTRVWVAVQVALVYGVPDEASEAGNLNQNFDVGFHANSEVKRAAI